MAGEPLSGSDGAIAESTSSEEARLAVLASTLSEASQSTPPARESKDGAKSGRDQTKRAIRGPVFIHPFSRRASEEASSPASAKTQHKQTGYASRSLSRHHAASSSQLEASSSITSGDNDSASFKKAGSVDPYKYTMSGPELALTTREARESIAALYADSSLHGGTVGGHSGLQWLQSASEGSLLRGRSQTAEVLNAAANHLSLRSSPLERRRASSPSPPPQPHTDKARLRVPIPEKQGRRISSGDELEDESKELHEDKNWWQRYGGADPLTEGLFSSSTSQASGFATPAKKKRCCSLPVIHPYSRARRDLNLLVALSILYVLISLPYELCFNVHPHGPWLAVEVLVDMSFIVDMVVNFRTGFVEKGRQEIRDGLHVLKPQKVVMDPARIQMNYLKTWFLVDLVSSFPFDIVFLTGASSEIYLLQFLRLFRLLRLRRLLSARAELQETWSLAQYEVFETFILLFYIMYFCHVGSCIFIGIGKTESSPNRWLNFAEWDRDGEAIKLADADDYTTYVATLYLFLVTFSSVGYGDLHPSNTVPERLFAVVFLSLCMVLLGYVVGKISSLIILRGKRKRALRERFATLHAYIEHERLPDWLATRLMVHLSRQWQSQVIEFDDVELLKDLTDELRTDLFVHWWRKNIPRSILFPHKQSFLIQLLGRSTTQVLSPGDVICTEGEQMRHLIIVRSGTLDVTRSVDLALVERGEATTTTLGVSLDWSKYSRPDLRRRETEDVEPQPVASGPGSPNLTRLTEVATAGTIIGETPLMEALSAAYERSAGHDDEGLKYVRVEFIKMDVCAVCKGETTVMFLLIDDVFDIMEQYPSLVTRLKLALGWSREEVTKTATKFHLVKQQPSSRT